MRALSLVLALSFALPASVSAHAIFVPHQGGPTVISGHGGASVSSHGIKVWTDGSPSQRFQVLGVIRDERTDKVFDGSALHSAAIAKLVRAQGGDGVIVGAVGSAPVAVLKGAEARYGERHPLRIRVTRRSAA
ncbi:hypothetical protein [Sphingomonas oryzagri]